MKNVILLVFFSSLLFSKKSFAQDSCDGKCVSNETLEKVKIALKELENIKNSPATGEFKDEIVIVHDWDGRVYINGGNPHPIKMKLKIGDHIDRDMELRLPVVVYYREKPPDPMFRLRFRAQFGLLIPSAIDSISSSFDAGIGLDWFHYSIFNTYIHAGFRSSGAGLGVDITKNFGFMTGYSVQYDGWKSQSLSGFYFSFNLSFFVSLL